MNFYYIFLLLLVVLSAFFESPQHGKPPDPLDFTVVAVCPNSSSDPLGVLAPVLPQSEMFGTVLPQNMVLPQNEVYRTALPQNEVYRTVLPQNGVFEVVPSQNEMSSNVIVNCQLSDRVKNTVNSLLNIGDRSIGFLTSTVIYGAEKSAWTVRILLECLQHVLKMYAWSLSENHNSIQFKCR